MADLFFFRPRDGDDARPFEACMQVGESKLHVVPITRERAAMLLADLSALLAVNLQRR